MTRVYSIGFIAGLAISVSSAALANDPGQGVQYGKNASSKAAGAAAPSDKKPLFNAAAVIRNNEFDAVDCLQQKWRDGSFNKCLEDVGQPEDVIDFASAMKRRNNGIPSLLVAFTDFGKVDYAEIVLPAANTIDRYGVVTGGDRFTSSDGLLDESATSDPVSLNLRRANPRSMRSARSRVVGHRYLANGRQRFVIRDAMLDGCRACETVAHVYGYVEFDGPRLVEQETIGWRPSADGHWPDPDRVRQRLAAGDVRTLQTRLNAAGYLAGAMDGAFGPMTRSALQEFQQDHCLSVGADWRRGETTDILASLVTVHSLKPAPAPCTNAASDAETTGAMAMTDREGLSIENSGPDFFNIFTALVSDACVGRDCTYYTSRTTRRCDDVCAIEGHEGDYVAHSVSMDTARYLAGQSTDQARMISQQGVPRGMEGKLAPREIQNGLPSQVFRQGCEATACESVLVLLLNEGEGYFFDIPTGVTGALGEMGAAEEMATDHDAPQTGAATAPSGPWMIQSEPDIVLEPGQETMGIAFHQDGGASYHEKTIWPAPDYMDRYNRLHVLVSPGGEMAVVRFQEVDYGGIRAGLIDLETGTIMTDHLVTDSGSRGSRYLDSVAWSPDGRFGAVPFRTFEYFNHVVFFSTGSGDTGEPYRVENEGRVLTPDIESISILEDGRARFTVIEEICDSTGCMMRDTSGSRAEHVDLAGLAGPEDPDDTPSSGLTDPGKPLRVGLPEEGGQASDGEFEADTGVNDASEDEGTVVSRPDPSAEEDLDPETELSTFDKSLSGMRTATEFFGNLETVYYAFQDVEDLLHAQRLMNSILSPDLVARSSADAAIASGGMSVAGFTTKYLVKHAYAEEAPFTRFISEEVALSITDAMFNIASGVLTGGVGPLISQSISTTSNIIDSVIAYRELGRDTDALVANARTYGTRTLELHETGVLSDAQARAHFDLAKDLSETLLGRVPLATWAPSREAAYKLQIISHLGKIRIEQGPLGFSLERTEEVRDDIQLMDTWKAPGPTVLRGPVFKEFADEVAEQFRIMHWDPMVGQPQD